VLADTSGDFDRVRSLLRAQGVTGVDDFGYFANNTEYFRPSSFDERAAMPFLLELLPTLSDPKTVEATARHLCRPWAKSSALPPLVEAFRSWAPREPLVGWAIGDSLICAAGAGDVDTLLRLAQDRTFGMARQMIVHSLWRFRKDQRVAQVLTELSEDPDVCLHAMSALRRTIGNDASLPLLHHLSQTNHDDRVREQAAKELKKAERASTR
jgi:HEAT repeat protein